MVSQGEAVKRALKIFMNEVTKATILDITANLTASPARGGTPVDTGWARANWIPAIGRGTTEPTGDPESVSTAAQQTGIATISTSYTIDQGIASINNNVPYIGRLNEGSSQQAPRGFIQLAILKAVKIDVPAKVAALSRRSRPSL